jgi:hypothetical protein
MLRVGCAEEGAGAVGREECKRMDGVTNLKGGKIRFRISSLTWRGDAMRAMIPRN